MKKKLLKTRDEDWSILNSCIMGYRSGKWDIPALNTGSIRDKCQWINSHNNSRKQFNESDWKNARRPERQKQILPKYKIQTKLHELQRDLPPIPVSPLLKENAMCHINARNQMDGLQLLSNINDNTVTLAFYDPEYREVLDYLHYGDEGKRQTGRVNLPQMSPDVIHKFISELYRIIKPSGYMMLWIDKYLLNTGIDEWINGVPFKRVDMLTWDKGKIGMGSRLRCSSEFLIIFQKDPISAKATWSDHSISDIWHEKARRNHPHAKPIGLQKRLIIATTSLHDVVCDPAAGSYSVLQCCKETGRTFIGCDLI